jgi:hypothetical protein
VSPFSSFCKVVVKPDCKSEWYWSSIVLPDL